MSMSDNCKWLRWSNPCNGAERYITWFLLMLLCAMVATDENSECSGCFLVSDTDYKFIRNDCLMISHQLYGCAGCCHSSAFPTSPDDLETNPNQTITSRASCCGITQMQDIPVTVSCAHGPENFILKSAVSCECTDCKKDLD